MRGNCWRALANCFNYRNYFQKTEPTLNNPVQDDVDDDTVPDDGQGQ